MWQKFIAIAVFSFILVGVVVASQGRYVRKQLQPDFFIPKEDVFNQPEKLPPLPKKEVVENVDEKIEKTVDNSEYIREESKKVSIPEYQKKFDDYNRDISYINRSGEIPVNSSLKSDLDQMNSNDLFNVQKKELGSETEVSRAFMKILNKSIAEN